MPANHVTLEALALCVATGTPSMLWGDPGTGKTSAIEQLVASIEDCALETLIASIHDPSDFLGLPVPNQDRDAVNFIPPAWALRIAKANRGVVFFDELSTSPRAVQAALLRIVFSRVVGELELGPQVSFVAAANPPETAAGGFELSPPLAYRFVHLDWTPDPAGIASGLIGGFPTIEVPRIGGAERDPRAAALVGAFLLARPALAVAMPADPVAAGRGFPTPRSWEMVIRLLSASWAADASAQALHVAVIGAVGQAAGAEFLAFLDTRDLPDPEALLANSDTFEVPTRGDQKQVIAAAVAAAVTANATTERWDVGWRVLARLGAGAVDTVAGGAFVLARNRPADAAAPAEIKLFIPMLRKAGLLPPGMA
ncbi:MAG: AAA family ATPase [Acidimicrobiales bacterium]|nr:AAA family ATPase [Acidimicrobiales bacterium]